jgi:hypothetical protein
MSDVRLTAQARLRPVQAVLTDAARLRAFIDALLTPTQPIVWHDDTPPPSQGCLMGKSVPAADEFAAA